MLEARHYCWEWCRLGFKRTRGAPLITMVLSPSLICERDADKLVSVFHGWEKEKGVLNCSLASFFRKYVGKGVWFIGLKFLSNLWAWSKLFIAHDPSYIVNFVNWI